MKKLFFLCSMLFCCITAPAFAGITFNSPTVTSGSSIVFTAVGEGVGTNGYIDPSSLGSYYICVAQLSSYNPPACGGTGTGDFSSFFTVRGPFVTSYNCTTHAATTITFTVTRLNIANINFNISFNFAIKTSSTCGGTGTTTTNTALNCVVFPYGTYGNSPISKNYTRNNCGTGYTGSTVFESIPINTYASTVSQTDADNQANTAAQNDANTNGNCTATFAITNTSGNALSMTFTRTDKSQSPIGGVVAAHSGTTYPFTIPNGTYTVTISPAGMPVNCTMTFNPIGQTYGPAPGHTFTGIVIGSTGDSSFTAN